MAEEIINPSDVTVEMLHELLDAAYIEHRVDEDGDILINERYKVWMKPLGEGRRIKLFAVFGFEGSATYDERLAGVNLINDDLVVIRAAVPLRNPDVLDLDYYISVDGGITKRSIVKSVKMFMELVDAAIEKIEKIVA
jgi:hypothetical protein